MNWSIRVQNLDKVFFVERARPTAFKLLKRTFQGRRASAEKFFALKDINLDIGRGEKLGIVGNNGSGKTTLLKVVAGLFKPDRGRVEVDGSIAFLAGLGIGMIDDLSVERNVYLYGMIFGLEVKTIRDRLQEIIAWAELQDFSRAKLKTLSAGMRTRLAFSAVRHIDADIFLLDETLTTGDKNFKEKCQVYFESQKNTDKTYLVATHDLVFVKQFCRRTLWLHKGQPLAFGETDRVLKLYLESGAG
ncbi:MAG: ATP-binding cassette domain-containing protein [Candidatus Aminicenantes bacterium]|nr:ATP-binding cassette domain-containing protein [Candidatus Aminicenantes bacterium]